MQRMNWMSKSGAMLAILALTAPFTAGLAEARTFSFVSAGTGTKTFMVELTTGKVVAEIPMSGPLGEVVAKDGIRYMANTERDEVSVFEKNERNPKEVIPVGKGPFAVVLSLDGKRLFVMNRISNDLSVIDVKCRKVVQTDAAPVNNFGMHISSDGKNMSMSK